MPLSDRYEVLARVGQGAFGEVFRVRERRSGLEAAAKRLRVPPPADALQVLPAALFREVEALRQLRHPNVRVDCSRHVGWVD
jgi:serine/threonine protein kinase